MLRWGRARSGSRQRRRRALQGHPAAPAAGGRQETDECRIGSYMAGLHRHIWCAACGCRVCPASSHAWLSRRANRLTLHGGAWPAAQALRTAATVGAMLLYLGTEWQRG